MTATIPEPEIAPAYQWYGSLGFKVSGKTGGGFFTHDWLRPVLGEGVIKGLAISYPESNPSDVVGPRPRLPHIWSFHKVSAVILVGIVRRIPGMAWPMWP